MHCLFDNSIDVLTYSDLVGNESPSRDRAQVQRNAHNSRCISQKLLE